MLIFIHIKILFTNICSILFEQLTPDVKSIRVNAAGKGVSLLELAYRYNISTPETQSAFTLKPKVKQLDDDHMNLMIATSYRPPGGKGLHKQSNMVILEIALPSGYALNTELLNGLKKVIPSIKLIETKNGDTVAVIYFDYLTSDAVTLEIDGFREYIVDEQKPTPIIIYDYYDSGKKSTLKMNPLLKINSILFHFTFTALSAREFYSL